ncbi:Nuclear pore complex protein NUP107 [Camellia lanceoleosa]|uniref:Nuclear pore complex protein NUP107 n=1 Tax=Camellia lanceoleosa TaxID=1840588 RepID=A0ACC0IFI9_9ERIC|nr:Nuclear pore complex protein NUP107 [Camellia lanceoleosa]
MSSTDNDCIEVVLRCLATGGDGLGPHELNDGSILATVIAAGFKGELVRFQAGVTMEISRLDACIQAKMVLWKAQLHTLCGAFVEGVAFQKLFLDVSVLLVESGNPPESHDELIELDASPKTGFLHLFSQQQLQREYWICKLELGEELPR